MSVWLNILVRFPFGLLSLSPKNLSLIEIIDHVLLGIWYVAQESVLRTVHVGDIAFEGKAYKPRVHPTTTWSRH